MQHVHHLLGIRGEALLADGHADERDALHRLGAQHPVLLPGRGDENLLQKRQHRAVILRERRLRVVRDGRERRQRGLLHHRVPALQHREELVHELVQERRHVLGRALLGEVHHRRRRVRLHAVRRVFHRAEQSGENARVVLLLKLRAEVRAQLSDAVHRGPAHARVRVGRDRVKARRHRAGDVFEHALDAPFRDLRQRDERGVTLAPVLVLDQRRDRRRGARQHRVRPERDRDAVEALLPHVVPLALARVAVLLLLRGVPARVVLDVEQKRRQAVEQTRDEVRELAHHPRRAVARLAQRDQELRREVPRPVLEVVVLRDRHHRVDDVRQMFPHESRV
mmetsp:Transcript_172865/g.420484  ORF Transcript_172865/g.420484 Transcript_172865/m.420484 type:complete len:337 (+) Transcript_172865:1658-2668(+)